jgi:hypothetical protein
MKNNIRTSVRIVAVMILTAMVLITGKTNAQVVIGGWLNGNNDNGWIDYGNGDSITNSANAGIFSFVSNAVPGYSQSLQITDAGYNHVLAISLEYTPGDMAAFLTNQILSFTFSVPAGTYTGGYSQVYALAINASGYGFNNINLADTTATGDTNNNQSGQPNFYFADGTNGLQTETVSFNYSSILPSITATPSSGYIELVFTSNNGGGAPANYFLNNVELSSTQSVQTTTYVVDNFDPAGVGPQNPTNYDYYSSSNNYAAGQITNVWGNWFGGAFESLAWDPTGDANNDTNSGSMEISLNFNSTNSQFVVWDQGTVNNYYALNISGSIYTNFQCDVRFAPGSASSSGTLSSNVFGELRFGTRTASYGQDWFGSVDVASTDTNWVHVSVPLNDITDLNLTNITSVLIGIDGSGDINGLTLNGPSTIWVDNIKFTGPATIVAPPAPVLSVQKAIPALRIFAGSSVNTYDREELATTDQSQSWIGGSYPVSYSFTLLDYPADIDQTHIFIVPVNTSGQADTGNNGTINEYVEYQASNTLWMVINPGATDVIATVQWKTNLPNSNPNITAVTVTNSTAVGTWTLTFNSATSGTLTAPGAAPAAFTIADPTVTSDFANPAIAYFGLQPNSTAGEGQYEDWQSISVTGVSGTKESEDFSSETTFDSEGFWANNSAQTNSIQLVTTNTPYWVNWTLPATGFALGTSDNVLGSTNAPYPWMLPEYFNGYGGTGNGTIIPGIGNQGTKSWVLIPSTCLPTADGQPSGVPTPNGFFKLFNPPLQN